ncbi:hypothetical protein ABQH43_01525 [Streptococcus sp. ZJ100]|uniref:hypothetical protein n=1 Tax=Streptococcus handemini TaxID=3161188 RepID=UPI0032EE0A8F
MAELDYKQGLLVSNWQKKNYQLSQLVIDSLEGLDVWETVLALGNIRKDMT